MQEEIENRAVNLAVTSTRLSSRVIITGLRMYMQHRDRQKALKSRTMTHGKMTVKQLIGQNQGVTSIPLNDERISDFQRMARKYGVDYAVTKDSSVTPARYMIFFKARDTDALTAIIKDYTEQQLSRKEHPSLLKQLQKLKAIAASLPGKVRNKEQEHAL